MSLEDFDQFEYVWTKKYSNVCNTVSCIPSQHNVGNDTLYKLSRQQRDRSYSARTMHKRPSIRVFER